jgi:hypothetical protein
MGLCKRVKREEVMGIWRVLVENSGRVLWFKSGGKASTYGRSLCVK